jgi:hypothetical protein
MWCIQNDKIVQEMNKICLLETKGTTFDVGEKEQFAFWSLKTLCISSLSL